MLRTFFALVSMVVIPVIALGRDMYDTAVKDLLSKLVDSSDTPGVQYVAVRSDRVLLNTAAGYADIRNNVHMTSEHTMHVYSMTKAITAVAILQLAEKEKLSLDDKLIRYVPDHPYGDGILIRHLLNHTSGIPNPIPLKWTHRPEVHQDFDEDVALRSVVEAHPGVKSRPGERYAYSNIGYWYLGKVIEAVSGYSYEQYVTEQILKPLELSGKEIGFTVPSFHNHAKGYLSKYSFLNLLKGFLVNPGLAGGYEGRWLHLNTVYMNGKAYGGLVGRASAFGTFLQDQLKQKSRVLSKSSRKLLYTPQTTNNGNEIAMTLGWHIGNNEEKRYYYKEGGGAAYHSEMRIYPKDDFASVLIVNCTRFNTSRTLNNLDRHILDQPRKQ